LRWTGAKHKSFVAGAQQAVESWKGVMGGKLPFVLRRLGPANI